MNRVRMCSAFFASAVAVLLPACGQQELILPDVSGPGGCGPGYPDPQTESADAYAIETGARFPCLLFESVEKDGERTYLSFADLYLRAKYGEIHADTAVIVVIAENCPSCAVLMNGISESVADLEAAGAIMISAVWCDNVNRNDCDFDLDQAVAVAAGEGWPVDRWHITNDAEGQLRPLFSDSFPTLIAVRLSDMIVETVDSAPTLDAIFEVVNAD